MTASTTDPAHISAAPETASGNVALEIRIAAKVWPPVGGRPEQTVLRNVTLDIAPRSFVVVSGPSGCGKSTLLNIIAGLDGDYDGTIRFAAADPRLAFIFQSPRLLPWRTVEENIALVLPDGDARRANIPELLSRVGLSGAETAYPERLSLGMQRRVAIARGFILEPDILLMDEPFVSLDDPTADGLRALVLELWHRHPTTVLFVTHDRREAVRLATRVVRLGTAPAPGQSSVIGDTPVTLSLADRADPLALVAEQSRVFASP
jgi:NitT/TauT family transport system ATP-binding protein